MTKLINPANGKLIGEVAFDSLETVEAKLCTAAAAFQKWRDWKVSERSGKLKGAAQLLRQRRGNLATIAAREMGKPLSAGEVEVSKCAVALEHYAQSAEEMLKQIPLATSGGKGYLRFEPLGVILGIMPWNYPYWQVIRFAAASLAAGNVVVLKHAPMVPGCAAALESVFTDAGFTKGVFQSIRVEDSQAQKLCAHPLVAAVTLTGSDRAGAAVAATAGGAIKKTVMELGGSDPFVVLADADVEFAAASAAEARCVNSGQSCIAAKRFIVDASVLEKFTEAFAAAMKKQKVGDPMDPATLVGPLARKDLLDNLQRQVESSVKAGARVLIGGAPLSIEGFYYPPTILTDVRPGMAVFDEETFGPVAAVVSAKNTAEAIELANQTLYGLGASLWTRDLAGAEKLAGEIDCGSVFINAVVRSDPRMPFGGIKRSGWGRELAEAGLKEFMNVKTVWVNKA